MKSQASQATKPVSWRRPVWAIALRLPMVAIVPLVEVVERFARAAVEGGEDVFRGRLARLDGGGGEAGEELAVRHLEVGEVADDEDVGMAGDREVGADLDAAGAVERDAEGAR